jgi:hypothetical protein
VKPRETRRIRREEINRDGQDRQDEEEFPVSGYQWSFLALDLKDEM